MRTNFFFEMFKIKCGLQKCKKTLEKTYTFLDNWSSIGCDKISLLPTEYFSSALNVLTNGFKILYTTITHIFELKFSQSVRKIR